MIAHHVGPGVMGPEMHIAQVAALQVAQQPGAGHAGGQGLGFAVVGDDQALRAELGDAVFFQVLHGGAEMALVFPVLPGRGILRLILHQGLERFRTHAVGADAEVFRQEGGVQFRMARSTVITLAIVLDHQLPVAVLDDLALVGDLAELQGVGREAGRHLGRERSDVLG